MMRTLSLITVLAVLAGLALIPFVPSAVADDPVPAPAGWGTIKGQIVFAGNPPTRTEVKVDKDKEACLAKGPILGEDWVVNPKNKGVRWAVVWLAASDNLKAPEKKMPIHPNLAKPKVPTVEMDQPCCVYEPHVVAMREDQKLIFKNSSAIAHNVNYVGGTNNPSGNPILNPGAEEKVPPLKYSWTAMNVGCNIHGWMKAYVRVFDHPYFAVTDADGNFEIKDAPAGNYYMIVWQESIGIKDSKAKLEDGKNVIRAGTMINIVADKTTDVGQVGIGGDKK